MYLHLGQGTVVRKQDILGIFDPDTATVQKASREYLNTAQKKGELITVSYELPKSFVVCAPPKRRSSAGDRVYVSQISPATLRKRARLMDNL